MTRFAGVESYVKFPHIRLCVRWNSVNIYGKQKINQQRIIIKITICIRGIFSHQHKFAMWFFLILFFLQYFSWSLLTYENMYSYANDSSSINLHESEDALFSHHAFRQNWPMPVQIWAVLCYVSLYHLHQQYYYIVLLLYYSFACACISNHFSFHRYISHTHRHGRSLEQRAKCTCIAFAFAFIDFVRFCSHAYIAMHDCHSNAHRSKIDRL